MIELDSSEYISKAELIEWVQKQIIEVRSRDDNVVTRLGITAGLQMVLEKLNE